MASSINTNISSLTAQRNLSTSQTSLATSMQRLSSGLRINSAKDDAAGLAISERFTTQIRGLNQASRNANDGISLAQTAEGSLGEITSNLQRIRELAVQSANSTNSASDRAALDLEVEQRLAEIDRVASQSSFNGTKILDGTFGNATFQVGANVGETIGVSLATSMRQSAIGAIATATSVDLDTLINAGTPAVTGSAATYAFDTTAIVGVDYSVAGSPAAAAVFTATNNLPVSFDFSTDQVSFAVAVDGGGAQTVTLNTNTTDQTGFLTAINGQLTGATASVAGGKLVITSDAAGASSAIAVSAFNGNVDVGGATIADFASGTETTPGAALIPTTNQTFTINDPDGATSLAITVDADLTGDDGTLLLAEITGNAGYAAAGFTAALVSGNIVLTDKTNATGSFTITGTNATLVTAQNVAGSTAAGVSDVALVPAGTVTVGASGDFSIAIGTGTAVDVAAGIYSTQQSLVDAVNTALGGNGFASLDAAGVMTINSAETIAVTGNTGTATLGLAASSTASGSLSAVTVATVAGANDTIQRVDSALTSVSTLRSTFGAIQNRFESVIANLSTTSENLSAARSRIQDADFATETANLSRAQILQQAGTAMVAQANQLPQGVLALLR